jgi:hypothetical protein
MSRRPSRPPGRALRPKRVQFLHPASSDSDGSAALIETMGGGVAILDHNTDGPPDLFFSKQR